MKKNKFGKKRIVSSKLIIISLVLSLLILLSSLVLATPNSINIQGKITNPSDNILTGTFNFTFRIYDTYTGGNKLYEKANLTSATDPRGVYDIIIKDINISFDKQLYLGIELNSDGEMSPRINLTSVPYSFRANTSDELDVNRSYTVLGFNVTENITLGDKITFRLRETIDNLVDGFLRISGSLNVTESLIVLGGVNISGDLKINELVNITSGDIVAAGTIGISGTGDSYILGNLGIGTVAPGSKLTVIGGVNVSGGLNISGDLSVNTEINLTALGNIRASGTIFASQIDIGGGFGSGGLTIQPDGDIVTEGDILFSGNITVLNVTFLSVNGSITPNLDNTFDIGNESFRWRSIYAVGFNLTSNNLELLGDAYIGGNVGIGTTSPGERLEVSGNISLTKGSDRSIYVTKRTGTGAGDDLSIIAGDGADDGGVTPFDGGNVKIDGGRGLSGGDAGNVLLASTRGNVGIGQASPNVTLGVSGDVNITGFLEVMRGVNISNGLNVLSGNVGFGTASPSPGINLHVFEASSGVTPDLDALIFLEASSDAIFQLASGTNSQAGIYLGNSADGGASGRLIFDGNSNFLGLGFGADNHLSIDSSGDVGIGTTTPAHKLHIIGNVNITGSFNATRIEANEILVNGAIVNRSIDLSTYNFSVDLSTYNFSVSLDDYNLSISLTNYLLKIGEINSTAWNRTGTNVILANTGDNVGIGTTSPTEKLVVMGNLSINKSTASAGSSNITLFVDSTNARVGIGTAAPTETLEVKGGIKYTDSDEIIQQIIRPYDELDADAMTSRLTFSGLVCGQVNNTINCTMSGGDPIFFTNFDFEPILYPYLVMRYQTGNNFDSGSDYTVRFGADEAGGNVVITIFPDGKWHTALVDVSGVNGGNAVTNLRVDFTDGGAAEGLRFNLSYIAVGNVGSGIGNVYAKRGNVGIGTTSPSTLLHVNGGREALTIDADNSIGITWINFTIGDEVGSYANFELASTFFVIRSGQDPGGISLFSKGGTGLTVDENGNVGIGTTSPAAKLTVIGQINGSGLNISGDGFFGGNLRLGIFAESIADAGFNLDGDGDLFVNGELGVNSVAFFDTTVTIDGTLDLDGNSLTAAGDLTIDPAGDQIFLGAGDSNVDVIIDDGGLAVGNAGVTTSVPADGNVEIEDGSMCIGDGGCTPSSTDGDLLLAGDLDVNGDNINSDGSLTITATGGQIIVKLG